MKFLMNIFIGGEKLWRFQELQLTYAQKSHGKYIKIGLILQILVLNFITHFFIYRLISGFVLIFLIVTI